MKKNRHESLPREWCSARDAQDLTGRSQWSWRRDAYTGRIASAKIGTKLMFRISDVRAAMEANLRLAVRQ